MNRSINSLNQHDSQRKDANTASASCSQPRTSTAVEQSAENKATSENSSNSSVASTLQAQARTSTLFSAENQAANNTDIQIAEQQQQVDDGSALLQDFLTEVQNIDELFSDFSNELLNLNNKFVYICDKFKSIKRFRDRLETDIAQRLSAVESPHKPSLFESSISPNVSRNGQPESRTLKEIKIEANSEFFESMDQAMPAQSPIVLRHHQSIETDVREEPMNDQNEPFQQQQQQQPPTDSDDQLNQDTESNVNKEPTESNEETASTTTHRAEIQNVNTNMLINEVIEVDAVNRLTETLSDTLNDAVAINQAESIVNNDESKNLFFKLMEENELSGDELNEMEQSEIVERVNNGDLHEFNKQNLQSVLIGGTTSDSNSVIDQFQLKSFRVVLKRMDTSELEQNQSGNFVMKTKANNDESSDSDSMGSFDLNNFNLKRKTKRLYSTESATSTITNSKQVQERVSNEKENDVPQESNDDDNDDDEEDLCTPSNKCLDFFLNANKNETGAMASTSVDDETKKKFFDLVHNCNLYDVLSDDDDDDDDTNSSYVSCQSNSILEQKKHKYISKNRKRLTRSNANLNGVSVIVRNADVLSTDDEDEDAEDNNNSKNNNNNNNDLEERENNSNDDALNSNESENSKDGEQNQATETTSDQAQNEEEERDDEAIEMNDEVQTVNQTFRLSSDDEILGKRSKNKNLLMASSDESKSPLNTNMILEPIHEETQSSSNDAIAESKTGDQANNGDDDDDDVQFIKTASKKRKRFTFRFNSSDDSADESGKKSSRLKKRDNKALKSIKKEKIDDDDEEHEDDKDEKRKRRGKNGNDEAKGEEEGGLDGAKQRPKIRKLIEDSKLTQETKSALTAENERKKRIEEKHKLEQSILDRSMSESKELFLDIDLETEEPILKVDKAIAKHLKEHQREGIKFMWDCCFERVEHIQNGDEGSGCILAHCMGLGKTAQVIALVHTLLTNRCTKVKRVIILVPKNVLNSWQSEVKKWTRQCKRPINFHQFPTNDTSKKIRMEIMEEWWEDGGVLLLTYTLFCRLTLNLTTTTANVEANSTRNIEENEMIENYLLSPGADLIVCDEGHLLKSERSQVNRCLNQVSTKRRIVLTGTPLQNNLEEYFFMVSFVKPNLLGTLKEFRNRFVNPINFGLHKDSTESDVRIMRKRAHVLHDHLAGCVQRKDFSVMTKYLPKKKEYVLAVRLSQLQVEMYRTYLMLHGFDENKMSSLGKLKSSKLFRDKQILARICSHPWTLKMRDSTLLEQKARKAKKSLAKLDEEEEDFEINEETSDIEGLASEKPNVEINKALTHHWWESLIKPEHEFNLELSGKLVLLKFILKWCKQKGDKVLLFSESLLTLNIIEHFLAHLTKTKEDKWIAGTDYFRLDGSTDIKKRKAHTNSFNNPNNKKTRLFLISTKAGGIGINLTGANRCILFDASWNPSYDVQSMFRVFRFGQTKNVYIYRLLALGTMEEKIYQRQVTKQSLAQRVIDEHQIDRHFTSQELRELYAFEPDDHKLSTDVLFNMPEDGLLKELLSTHKQWIGKYHEHDSLLENKIDEGLTEEERAAAWAEYERDKDKEIVPRIPALPTPVLHDNSNMNYIIDMVGSNYDELIKNYNVQHQLPNNHHRHINHNNQQYQQYNQQHNQQLAQHHRQAQPNNHQHQTQNQMFQRFQQLQNEYQQSSLANQYRELEQRLAQPVINQIRTAESTNYNQNRAHMPNSSSYNTNAIINENDDLFTDIDDSQLFPLTMPYDSLWQQINNIKNIENRLENQPIKSSNFNSNTSKF